MSPASMRGSPGDTIFAMATGAGRAAISVIRLSGADAGRIVRRLAGRKLQPRRASLCRLRERDGAMLDHALVLWMPGPASYTGEDTAELHLHGGKAVAEAVVAALVREGGRPADPGEFTRRAFLAGKMDLLEAEAVAELAQAETEMQRQLALKMLGGAASQEVAGWAARLQQALAYQEAAIDFPDEAAELAGSTAVMKELHTIAGEIDRHLAGRVAGARVREGLLITISGPPNVGKSSLFNLLSGRDLAMVSPVAGTTRDTLEARLDLGGIAVTLIDTAGLRETEDGLEAEGIARARARAAEADIVIHVTDPACPTLELTDPRVIWVENKADLAPARAGALSVSAASGVGMDALIRRLGQEVAVLTRSERDPVLTRARHVAALQDARTALMRATEAELPELRAEDLRQAGAAIGRLTGVVHTEALLDVIFSTFCIGK